MLKSLRLLILNIIGLLLLARFVLLIGDPVYGQLLPQSQPFGFYEGLRSVLSLFYLVTDWLKLPATITFGVLSSLFPKLNTPWFPQWPASQLALMLVNIVNSSPTMAKFLPTQGVYQVFCGLLDWLSLLGISLWHVVDAIVFSVVTLCRNLFWNIFIEFSFTKRKQASYQQALEKRAQDLLKLNVEYRNLSKEVSSLKESVVTDELTKVFNKRFFIEKIKHEFQKAQDQKAVLSLIMLDLDYFKRLNDKYGHLVGDDVLRKAADVARRATPEGCYCCRFGGEEFTIILPGKSLQETQRVAEVIKTQMPLLRFPDQPGLTVTVSQGVCTAHFASTQAGADLQTFEHFIKLADDELYRAKLNGRDQICSTEVK